VLRSGKVNYWTGDEVAVFEREFADYVGARHAVAVANGTVALELALEALGIGAGDEVVVPSRTFVATASAGVMRGARPVVADVDPESQNVTARTIGDALSPRTRAVIVVHLAGWPCEMEPILELARQRGLKLIEDCAQAHGAVYRGRRVGSLGDIAAFSFCQDKIITTAGEGGMVTTSDRRLWERAWSFKDHGKSLAALESSSGSGFRWVHDSFGTNLRLTAVQAAIGRVQLCKLEGWLNLRRRNARALNERFARLPALRVTVPPAHVEHAYYKHYVFCRPEQLAPGWDRDRIVEAINAEGVPCSGGICSEIYREKAFAAGGLAPSERLPVARALGETSLMFPVHPTLSETDVARMADAVERVLRRATRDSGV